MEQLVSVIIFGNSKKYMQRCINSIERQAYKNIEIIKVIDELSCQEDAPDCDNKTNWYGINEAIANARGEYLVFANHTTVFSDKTIEFLVSQKNTENIPVCKIVSQTSILNRDQVILGGLFERKYFINDVVFDELCEYAELEVVYKYQEVSKQKEQVYSSNCIYDAVIPVRRISSQDLDLIDRLKSANAPNLEDNVSEIIKSILLSNPHYLTMEQVLVFAAAYKDNSEVSCMIARTYVKQKYEEFSRKPDGNLFDFFENYFSIFASDANYLRVIYIECGIYRENEALSYSIKSDPSDLKLDEIVVIASRLSGPYLANFFLDQVGQGKIGMKVLLKSIILWVKFKIKIKDRRKNEISA